MLPDPIISPPFFEIGPKAYLVGDEVLELAVAADRASAEHGVQVIFTTPFTDIARVAAATENLLVCAPHMDPIRRGRGTADILPEALKAAGANGVQLNHAERPIAFPVLERTIRRAEEVGLFTMVCASSLAEIRAVALLAPDIIVAEPTELIGTGTTSDTAYIRASLEAVRTINPNVLVLLAAGIAAGGDVFRVMAAGPDGTGSSSGVAKARDRRSMVDEMVSSARQGWESRLLESTQQRRKAGR